MTDWERGQPIWDGGWINFYSIAMTIGFIASITSIYIHWKRNKYDVEILQMLILLTVPTSLLGARFWYVATEGGWDTFFHFEGLSIQGGVAGAMAIDLPYIWYKQKQGKVDFRTTIGIIIPNVLIGQVIGRWGNFSNHEVYGKEISGEALNWLTFIKPHMYIEGAYRTPLFFYESMINLFGWFMIVWVLNDKSLIKPGSGASLYLFWYGLIRIIMEPLRDEADIMKIGDAPISMIIAGLSLAFGLTWFIVNELSVKPVNKLYAKFGFHKTFEKEYVLIKPKKMAFSLWKLKEVKKTYRIWVPIEKIQKIQNTNQ